MRRARWLAPVAFLALAAPAGAETEVSVYSGVQSAPSSTITGNDPAPGGVGAFMFGAVWEGRSFEAPPYYGARVTWWQPTGWGLALEFTHSKVYADDATLAANPGFSRLELTDGLNIVTLNAMRRWQAPGRDWTPYAGVGLGLAVPHVDVTTSGARTFGYQVTGPAAVVIGGLSYRITDGLSIFGEYKGSFSRNDAELTGGGRLQTDITTHALNFGFALNF